MDDGQGVIMNIAEGRFFGLNAVGRRIWERLAAPQTLAELSAAIGGDFAVDAATCQAEVTRFVGDMVNRGIIRGD
jgi:Coenzyme PQQ synthesis protein D (PqqD)